MGHTDDFIGLGEFPLGAKCKTPVVIGSAGMTGGLCVPGTGIPDDEAYPTVPSVPY